jgi:hypothetical protein
VDGRVGVDPYLFTLFLFVDVPPRKDFLGDSEQVPGIGRVDPHPLGADATDAPVVHEFRDGVREREFAVRAVGRGDLLEDRRFERVNAGVDEAILVGVGLLDEFDYVAPVEDDCTVLAGLRPFQNGHRGLARRLELLDDVADDVRIDDAVAVQNQRRLVDGVAGLQEGVATAELFALVDVL